MTVIKLTFEYHLQVSPAGLEYTFQLAPQTKSSQSLLGLDKYYCGSLSKTDLISDLLGPLHIGQVRMRVTCSAGNSTCLGEPEGPFLSSALSCVRRGPHMGKSQESGNKSV